MTIIDHAGALAVSRPETLSDEHVAARALQVARRTALGVLGEAEAAYGFVRRRSPRRAARLLRTRSRRCAAEASRESEPPGSFGRVLPEPV
jgi:hypothetical protein